MSRILMKCQSELEFPAIIFFIYFYLYILNHLKAEKKKLGVQVHSVTAKFGWI